LPWEGGLFGWGFCWGAGGVGCCGVGGVGYIVGCGLGGFSWGGRLIFFEGVGEGLAFGFLGGWLGVGGLRVGVFGGGGWEGGGGGGGLGGIGGWVCAVLFWFGVIWVGGGFVCILYGGGGGVGVVFLRFWVWLVLGLGFTGGVAGGVLGCRLGGLCLVWGREGVVSVPDGVGVVCRHWCWGGGCFLSFGGGVCLGDGKEVRGSVWGVGLV